MRCFFFRGAGVCGAPGAAGGDYLEAETGASLGECCRALERW